MASSKLSSETTTPLTEIPKPESTILYGGVYLITSEDFGKLTYRPVNVHEIIQGLIVTEGRNVALLVHSASNIGVITYKICLALLKKMINWVLDEHQLKKTDISMKRIASFDVANFFKTFKTRDMGMVWKLAHAERHNADWCYISNSKICSNYGRLNIFLGTIGLSSLIERFVEEGITTIEHLEAIDDDVLRDKFNIKKCPLLKIKRNLAYLKKDSEVWKNVWLEFGSSLSPDVRKLALITKIAGI